MGWKPLMVQKKDAANKAAKKQQKVYNQAVAMNAFGDQSYTQAQQSIMNNLINGVDPTASQAEVDKKMETITPTVNSQFSNNVWSTSRGKALTNAAQNAEDSIVASKKASQMAALDILRQEAANRANIKVGQAAAVTPKATTFDSVMDTLNATSNMVGAGAEVASLFIDGK